MLQKILLIFSCNDYFRAIVAIETHGNYISTPDHVEKNLRNTQMKFSESPDSKFFHEDIHLDDLSQELTKRFRRHSYFHSQPLVSHRHAPSAALISAL